LNRPAGDSRCQQSQRRQNREVLGNKKTEFFGVDVANEAIADVQVVESFADLAQ